MQASEVAARIKAAPAGSVKITFDEMAVQPWDYQRNDAAWMLAQKSGIIGSEVGTGKTVYALAVASYLKARGEFRGMVVLMPKMAGVLPQQWEDEIKKFTPNMHVVHGRGKDKHYRIQAYSEPWDILLLNYEAARNDAAALAIIFENQQPSILFADEASAFRNGASKTARMVRVISPHFEYGFAATGTPMQTNLEDLHGICSSMGWTDLVGTKTWFQRQYCIRQKVEFYAGGMKRSKWVTVGYKNMDELRERLEPWFIRRTLNEPEVARRIPSVVPFVFRIPMRPAQVRLYEATKKGILAEIESGQMKTGYVSALQKFAKLSAVADGTQTYNAEANDHSAKSDWLLAQLQGSMAGEKVLVFSRFVRSIRPLQRRMERAGIGYGLFLGGDHQTHDERMEDVRRFREDDDCRVLLATQAVEMGLNLAVAKVLVFYGILPNPKRMEQVLGRIRRAGSPYTNVASITLLSADTVEEGIYETVLERNAVADVFWKEESVLFERLGEDRLIQLIRGYTP